MSRRACFLLFLLALGVISAVSVFQTAPGYMDADYYYAGGLRLAQGHGFSETILWNYLDDPAGLPHPSHAYWMPLASLLAALGMKLVETAGFPSAGLPAAGFPAARLGFLLTGACLPPLAARLAYALTGRRDHALLAGLIALFPAFYLPYLGTTDNFGIYMLLGGLWFLVVSNRGLATGDQRLATSDKRPLTGDQGLLPAGWLTLVGVPILLGLISGLMHLARSDGLLWLVVSMIAVSDWRSVTGDQRPAAGDWAFLSGSRQPALRAVEGPSAGGQSLTIASPITFHVTRILLLLAGYLLIMAPWFLRNLEVFGAPLAPGGSRALWLTRYDELYAYPATFLTPAYWWVSGLGAILEARLWALGQNLVRAFAVQGNIFLTPLILLGAWRLRKHPTVRLGGMGWLLTLLAMTAAFPFQSTRGGFFHSGAALQPLFWALAPAGLDAFVDWGVRVRNWQAGQARAVFGAGLVGLAVLLAALVFYGRVIGKNPANPSWAQSEAVYARLERAVQEIGTAPGEPVAVNNPPGYFAAAGRPAIAIPNGDVQTLVDASRRYSARLVILEYNHPQGLNDLYANPGDRPGLVYLLTLEDAHIFEVVGVP